jgi:hypothetical protein
MRTRFKTIAGLIVAVLLVLAGYFGHGVLDSHARAAGPWTVALTEIDCVATPVAGPANALSCAGQEHTGDANGDQRWLENVLARIDFDGCEHQAPVPSGNYLVVLYRC